MTSEAILNLLFAAADDLGRTFDYRDLAEWPTGSLQVFLTMGILRQSAGGLMASCPSCDDDHVELVAQRPDPDGQPRLYIYCPEQLRLEVSAEMYRGREVDLDGLATRVRSAMELKGTPRPLMPNRLWRLGRIPWEGKTREVMLATRLTEPDGASVAAHVGAGGRKIVLVPRLVPDDRVWLGRVPAVVALERIAELDGDRFVIDGVALLEAVAEADALALERGAIPQEQLAAKRRHVKNIIESMITNEGREVKSRPHPGRGEAGRSHVCRLSGSGCQVRITESVRRCSWRTGCRRGRPSGGTCGRSEFRLCC